MTVTAEAPLPTDRAELLKMLNREASVPAQPPASRSRQIDYADVAPFVGTRLNHNDLRLIARMARISQRGGSATLMRCLGIAARTPEEILDTIRRFENGTPPDQFAVDSLRAAHAAYTSGIEQRLEPSPSARKTLIEDYPRYADLLRDNRVDPANRQVQYYAMGRIAGMVASAFDTPPVQ